MTIKRKREDDKISALPDDVLCLILSFLPTKEAIATSLLSTRWRFVWTMVPSLHIECLKPLMKFYHRVKIFLGLRGTQKITSFHVQCNSNHCCCSHYVDEWISEIVARRVEQVNISLRTSHRSDLNLHELFTCTTIVNLKIEGPFELSIPYIIVLPNVKSLHIKVNVCYAVKNICNLIYQSQAFELFYLKYCLAELTIVRNSRYIQLINRNQFYDIDLQYDYDYISDIMRIHRWLRINKAKVYLTVHVDMGETFSQFLHGIPHVECLSLKYCSGDIHPSILDLPLFKNLNELRLFVKKDDSLIMELPARCPKLRVLEVNNLDDRQRCRYNIVRGARVHDLSIVPI